MPMGMCSKSTSFKQWVPCYTMQPFPTEPQRVYHLHWGARHSNQFLNQGFVIHVCNQGMVGKNYLDHVISTIYYTGTSPKSLEKDGIFLSQVAGTQVRICKLKWVYIVFIFIGGWSNDFWGVEWMHQILIGWPIAMNLFLSPIPKISFYYHRHNTQHE